MQCSCADSRSGVQACEADGTFGPCDCGRGGGAGGGGGDTDGGNGGGGGGGGGGDTDGGNGGGGGGGGGGIDAKPTVTLRNPKDGQTVSGIVSLEADASDDIGVARVEFLVDGQVVATDTASPYAGNWATAALVNGNYRLTARAVDSSSQTAEAAATVFVANASTGTDQPPQVRLIYPVNQSKVCGSITIEAAATDDVSVTQVEVFIDGSSLGVDTAAPFQKPWATGSVSNGPHVLKAVATDGAGQKAQHTLSATVDNAGSACDNLPSVSLTSPTRDVVTGQVAVAAAASDDVGVVKMQFFVDNGLIQEDATTPYAASWDSSAFSEGPHTLKALAYDTASQSSADVRQVTVDRTAPAVSITSPTSGAVLAASFGVTATASDNVGIDRIEFTDNGAAIDTVRA
ncbi:MAG: Ig-like domain-containing protein, partial [Myxococcaceae bacterium]